MLVWKYFLVLDLGHELKQNCDNCGSNIVLISVAIVTYSTQSVIQVYCDMRRVESALSHFYRSNPPEYDDLSTLLFPSDFTLLVVRDSSLLYLSFAGVSL